MVAKWLGCSSEKQTPKISESQTGNESEMSVCCQEESDKSDLGGKTEISLEKVK